MVHDCMAHVDIVYIIKNPHQSKRRDATKIQPMQNMNIDLFMSNRIC